MNKKLAYDLPTRLFHLIFALLFITSFAIAKLVDDESAAYGYHMLSGILMTVVILLRVLWGFFGSPYARFSSFELSPKSLLNYFLDLKNSKTKKYFGHNPASSYAAIFMMMMGLFLAFTGYNMVLKNNKETFEEFHEIFGNLFFITVILHVVGIFIHTIKHKELIGLSMLTGKKETNETVESINQHYLAAVVFISLVLFVGFNLYSHYQTNTGALEIFGNNYQLVDLD
jgi:cytochrome b